MTLPLVDSTHLRTMPQGRMEFVATTSLPTRHGEFKLLAFRNAALQEIVTLLRGDVKGQEDVPLRLHSECLTGDVFGSLRCDCGKQLEAALAWIGARDRGLLIYLPQEGRGIGLANKVRAYSLQDGGLDTVEANHALGFASDLRTYEDAAGILQILGVGSVALLTNNPDKIAQLRHAGIQVTRRIPLIVEPNPHNSRYLATKREKCGHLD
jgi:GTP cyclohydrolase II